MSRKCLFVCLFVYYLATISYTSRNKESDGFTVEFYIHFWPLLGEEMVQSFDQALILGHLNITQRQGIIKVVPKKRKK